MFGVIYKITNLINGKVYVGKTSRSNPRVRWYQHRDLARNGSRLTNNIYFYKALRKYGVENFKFEVIDQATSEQELSSKEVAWISQHKSCDPNYGYNCRPGGEGGKWSPEMRQRIGEGIRKAWASKSPEKRKAFSDMRREMMQGKCPHQPTAEEIEHLREIRLAEWAKYTPEERREMLAARQAKASNAALLPHNLEKRNKAIHAAWTPEKRAAWSERLRKEGAINRIRNHNSYKQNVAMEVA